MQVVAAHLKLSLSVRVELMRTGDRLDELLDDDPIVDARVAGVDLDVVVAGDGRDLNLPVAGRQEVLVLDPETFNTGTVHLPASARV